MPSDPDYESPWEGLQNCRAFPESGARSDTVNPFSG
jgi:hypothetical protein